MPLPSYRINEIFYSLQGEGAYSGAPAVFVRLSGCSMGCPFCDTDHAAGREYSAEEILKETARHPAAIIVLTGGEPAEQDVAALAEYLKKNGKTVHIETNGSIDFDTASIAHVTVSPKKNAKAQMLAKADALKLLVDKNDDLAKLEQFFKYKNGKTQLYLQPLSNKKENIDLCVSLVKKYPFLRLSVQLHKMINIPGRKRK